MLVSQGAEALGAAGDLSFIPRSPRGRAKRCSNFKVADTAASVGRLRYARAENEVARSVRIPHGRAIRIGPERSVRLGYPGLAAETPCDRGVSGDGGSQG